MKGFYAVLTADFHERLPSLRWAFLDGGSSWLPLVFQQHQRLISTSQSSGYVNSELGTAIKVSTLSARDMMAERNMFIACQTDDDLGYLAQIVGRDRLVFGSDYCHNDVGSDPTGHTALVRRADVDADLARRIVDVNGRRLLGVPTDFTPTASMANAS